MNTFLKRMIDKMILKTLPDRLIKNFPKGIF